MTRDLVMRPGLWARAGMGGEITGLDWAALRALIPPTADVERVLGLMALFEDGLLEGRRQVAEQDEAAATAREEMESVKAPE
jgi:hypothetical protein